MNALIEAARFLGIPAKNKPLDSPFQFLDYLDKGLPFSSIERVAGAYAPGDTEFRYRIVPKATLRKRRRNLAKARLTWSATRHLPTPGLSPRANWITRYKPS